MSGLADNFDAILLDLDGTVYLGHRPIPFVADTLKTVLASGSRPMYVTNNASRPPAVVAAQLREMGLTLTQDDVLTSPQAATALLVQRHPPGSVVLVVGAPYLADEVAAAGLVPVREANADVVAVVQGHSPDTGWAMLAEACVAIRAGADWVAANVDTTLPTDRGLLPGNGAMVAALMAATDCHPRVAGKPARAMIDEAILRSASVAPLVVGDRLDTDIEAAVSAGVAGLLVFTGVSSPADLLTASPARRPTFVSFDMRGLVDSHAVVEVLGGGAGWQVDEHDDTLILRAVASAGADSSDRAQDNAALHALAALAQVAWNTRVSAVTAGDERASVALARLGIGADQFTGSAAP
ncbi:HAD family hydrolase [Nakamurella antarctica]|uniref:HAD family hydrolase n=1 Tax=Nakamurella antarctica TaxID=1902245 RepID=A0A3G8ZJY8_9ACTN|nr:HAD hydrolase-like protein [Nakamurella antarctica]AZI57583.1 HAD family hydrolase [Nakamurella antarctica]